MKAYTQDQSFESVDFKSTPLAKGEYENCRFTSCDFSGTDLSEIKFLECEFVNCNLSLAKLNRTAFQEVAFRDCKMLGLHFDTCHDFGLAVRFENCQLNHSSFYERKIRKTLFKNAKLQEVDFTACDLTESIFNECELVGAVFDQTILEKVDFRTAYHYSFDPERNRIKGAKFSLDGLPGLLGKYRIEVD